MRKTHKKKRKKNTKRIKKNKISLGENLLEVPRADSEDENLLEAPQLSQTKK